MSYRDHIRHITKDKDHFWCHREKTQFDWAYVDLEHALVSKERDWIQPCKQCLKKAIAASQEGKIQQQQPG